MEHIADATTEHWVVCHGYPSYSVSSLGRVRRETAAQGAKVGRILRPCTKRDGYHYVFLCDENGQHNVLVHRLVAAAFVPNPRERPCVDHINGIRTDNRIGNLRWCTYSQNRMNSRCRVGSSSQFLGVSFHKATSKWLAKITVDGRNVHLGLFTDEDDAARAYDAAAREHHGEFANPNFKDA